MMIAMYNKDTLWVSSLASFVLWHYMLAPFDIVVQIRLDLPCQRTKTALFFNFMSPYIYAHMHVAYVLHSFTIKSKLRSIFAENLLKLKSSPSQQ